MSKKKNIITAIIFSVIGSVVGGVLTYYLVMRHMEDSINLASELIYGEQSAFYSTSAYEAYLNRSREKVDVFDVGRTWTAQVIDEIIEPKETRKIIIQALEITRNKKETLPARAKIHGSPPV